MTTPSLAIPAATIAIWSGVAATSNCPIADSAVWGLSGSSGKRLTAWRVSASSRSVKVRVPQPNFLACARRASSPTLSPTSPKETLQETWSALVRVISLPPQPPRFSLTRSLVVCGRSRVAVPGTLVSGVYLPDIRAAAEVTSLKVDPGGRVSSMALLSRGLGLAFPRRCLALPAAVKSWLASRLGLYDGLETIARILPVRGSIATTAPRTLSPNARSPSYAAFCASGSTVRVTLPPLGAWLSTRSITRLTNSEESLPDRMEFCVASTPPRPQSREKKPVRWAYSGPCG